MLTLQHFSPPPPKDKISVCENEGQLRSYTLSEAKKKMLELLGNYNVDVHIGQENVRSAYSKYEAKDAFSAHTETLWQRFIAAYYEEGFLVALRHLSLEEFDVNPILRKSSLFILKIMENFEKAKYYLSSPSRAPSIPLLDSSSLQVSCKLVVNLAWHPHTPTLAVVYADDTVRVFGKNRFLIPLLKHRLQKNITQVEWMPYCASILAVGCQSGILLWTLDPVSVVTRPSGSCLCLLIHQASLPLTSLSWYPKGLILAAVGGKGRELIVWDTATEEHCTVYSGIATCISMVSWSPDGSKLLAAMSTASIKVFETRNWSFEKWSLSCQLQSAVWSSNGRILLFVTAKEPHLFCLTFSDDKDGVGGALVATQVADLSAVVMTCEEGEEVRVGGLVKQLAWDKKSERLAVLFQDSEYIALFHTYTFPQLNLAPGGFIKGEFGHVPILISFQNNISNGAVLTTVWSGGEVNHLPLKYTSHEYRDVVTSFSHQNHSFITTPTSPAFNQSHILSPPLGPSSPIGLVPQLFSSPQ